MLRVLKITKKPNHLIFTKKYGNKSGESGVFAIRRESINLWERRAPLAPKQVKQLVQDGFKVLVQPSNRRAYTEMEYKQAGAIMQEDISEASLIIGVKKVPLDHINLIPNKTFAFFSHTIKAQEDNMELLDTILERKIRLIDYEKMLDDQGQRVVAFGQYAGIAGMINILHGIGIRLLALGHHTPFMHIGLAHNYRTIEMAKQAIRDCGYGIALGNMPKSIGPLTFVFTGTGNVSQGAQEMFLDLPYEFVEPEHLKDVCIHGDTKKIYACVVSRNDHYRRRSDNGFDPEEFDKHPELYISTFSKMIAPYASVIINGIYWAPSSPRLITIPDAKHLLQPEKTPWFPSVEDVSYQKSSNKFNPILEIPGCPKLPHRLIAICDISADPGGSIEFVKECTTIDKPFCLYDAEQNMSNEKFFGPGVLVCSVDNMPAQLPRAATDFFGSLLLPYIYEMIKSNAETSFDDFKVSPVVKNAVIASNGELTPLHKYIDKLRESKRSARLQTLKTTTGKRQVLILGSGHVVEPLISYLGKDKNIHITLGGAEKAELLSLADKFDYVNPELIDIVTDNELLEKLIKSHEVVVSMVPWKYHELILKHCIKQHRNMVTASYCTPDLEKYAKAVEDAGITALMEVGLDPGIDHMIAKDIFDDMSESGLNIVSYKSFTGGLPAPEFSENPLRYKFSWSPESALMTALNPAKYIENGKVKEIKAGGDLMLASKKMSILPGFNLQGYPNRDSTAYVKKYGLTNVHTLIRGTLRYKGFTDAMWSLIQMGLLSPKPDPHLHLNGPKITWKQFMCKQMEMNIDIFTGTLKNAVFEKLNEDKFKFSCLEDFELFKDIEIVKKGTPLATISHYLSQKLAYDSYNKYVKFRGIKFLHTEKNERDVVIMAHEVLVKWPENKLKKLDVRLVVYGDPNGFMAMATTVGYPTAIGVKMILDGEIQKKGIVLPLSVDIYRPMLKRLKKEGIEIIETTTIMDEF